MRRPRLLLALLAMLLSATPGLVTTTAAVAGAAPAAAPTASPVDPGGGCWRYLPGPENNGAEPTDIIDLSVVLEPWTASLEGPGFELATHGETAVGGTRSFAFDTLAEGPVLVPAATELLGTATVHWALVAPETGQRTELEPSEAEFVVSAGAGALPSLQLDGTVAITAAGDQRLVLVGIDYGLYVDDGDGVVDPEVDALVQRIACNGQPEGVPGGTNPATTPLDTAVTADFSTVARTTATLAAVTGQRVATVARAGDTAVVDVVGLASTASGSAALCPSEPGPSEQGSCTSEVAFTTTEDGAATVRLTVPAAAPAGPSVIHVVEGPRSADLPLRVLGAPTLDAVEETSSTSVRFQVDGTDWDPRRSVTVRPVDEAGEAAGRRLKLQADAKGAIGGRIAVGNADATALRAVQRHGDTELSAEVAIQVDGEPGPGDPGTDDPAPEEPGEEDVAPGDTTVPSTTPEALDIPVPEARDVAQVTAPVARDPEAGQSDLAVTDVRLVGGASVAELFGARPRRTLELTVENVGDAVVTSPGLTIAVGRGDDLEPTLVSDGVGLLRPGGSERLEIPITLPLGAFGTYTITGQIGDSEPFLVTWETYPWGLIGLNLLGLLLLAFATRRRVVAKRPASLIAAAPPADGAGRAAGAADEAVIDLETLERWWEISDAGGTATRLTAEVGAEDAVVDLEAVERFLERRGSRT
ncbi:hypothetical protein FXB39_15075 [Nocardioides sp. BGMRC 2183]|nr:hypothetical protein FXB39_15075 [Nocardioides sp. BGMRC 2183]